MRDSVDEAFFLNRNDQSSHGSGGDSSAHGASGNYFTDIISSSSSADNPLRGLAVYEAYDRSLSILWEWIQDGSGVSTAVVDICLSKLESLLNQFVLATHHRHDTEDKGETESSLRSHGLQWFCLSDLVIKAIDDIRLQRRNLMPSVRVLRIVLCSWAVPPRSRREDDDSTSSITIIEEPPSHGERRGPQQQLIPSRAALVEHLEEQFSFIATLATLTSLAKIATLAILGALTLISVLATLTSFTVIATLATVHTLDALCRLSRLSGLSGLSPRPTRSTLDARFCHFSDFGDFSDFSDFTVHSPIMPPAVPPAVPCPSSRPPPPPSHEPGCAWKRARHPRAGSPRTVRGHEAGGDHTNRQDRR
jgi:hypothetical protein